MINNS